MEIVIQARNVEVGDHIREYIEKKLQRLQRKLRMASAAQVELSWESTRSQDQRIVAQVTLNCNGTLVRGEERAPTVAAAIDAVADILDRRALQLKGRLYMGERAKKSGKVVSFRKLEASAATPEPAEEPLDLGEGKLVRVKRFVVKPMTVAEAATQMELLGHVFFLFRDGATGDYKVLYRRNDGNYGLIEPEPG